MEGAADGATSLSEQEGGRAVSWSVVSEDLETVNGVSHGMEAGDIGVYYLYFFLSPSVSLLFVSIIMLTIPQGE